MSSGTSSSPSAGCDWEINPEVRDMKTLELKPDLGSSTSCIYDHISAARTNIQSGELKTILEDFVFFDREDEGRLNYHDAYLFLRDLNRRIGRHGHKSEGLEIKDTFQRLTQHLPSGDGFLTLRQILGPRVEMFELNLRVWIERRITTQHLQWRVAIQVNVDRSVTSRERSFDQKESKLRFIKDVETLTIEKGSGVQRYHTDGTISSGPLCNETWHGEWMSVPGKNRKKIARNHPERNQERDKRRKNKDLGLHSPIRVRAVVRLIDGSSQRFEYNLTSLKMPDLKVLDRSVVVLADSDTIKNDSKANIENARSKLMQGHHYPVMNDDPRKHRVDIVPHRQSKSLGIFPSVVKVRHVSKKQHTSGLVMEESSSDSGLDCLSRKSPNAMTEKQHLKSEKEAKKTGFVHDQIKRAKPSKGHARLAGHKTTRVLPLTSPLGWRETQQWSDSEDSSADNQDRGYFRKSRASMNNPIRFRTSAEDLEMKLNVDFNDPGPTNPLNAKKYENKSFKDGKARPRMSAQQQAIPEENNVPPPPPPPDSRRESVEEKEPGLKVFGTLVDGPPVPQPLRHGDIVRSVSPPRSRTLSPARKPHELKDGDCKSEEVRNRGGNARLVSKQTDAAEESKQKEQPPLETILEKARLGKDYFSELEKPVPSMSKLLKVAELSDKEWKEYSCDQLGMKPGHASRLKRAILCLKDPPSPPMLIRHSSAP